VLLLAFRVRGEEVKYIWPGLTVPPPILIPRKRLVPAKSDASASERFGGRVSREGRPMTNSRRNGEQFPRLVARNVGSNRRVRGESYDSHRGFILPSHDKEEKRSNPLIV